jgi:hypothetical protein
VAAPDEHAATVLRQLSRDPKYGIGREIPKEELAKFPSNMPAAAAVYEAADGFMFSPRGPEFSKPEEIGNHGHWPMRYRAVYVLWGPRIKAGPLPEMSMKDEAAKFAKVIGVELKQARSQ